MSNFIYKNPIVGSFVTAPNSIQSIEDFYGSNFSVYNIGGYMEVWSLSDLEFTTNGQTGNIRYSGNTIPVLFNKATTSSLPDSITLYNDGISSGRRRLGMLVYVHENNTTYQFQIDADNSADSYENMWTAATAVPNLVDTTAEAITVKNRTGFFQPITQAGQDLIEAWTGSTIEGVNGVTRNNAKWRIFWGTDWQVTGGTIDYNSTGDLNLNSNSGNTVTISGLKTITGGTYFSGTSTIELYNNLGDTISITGITAGSGGSGTSGSSGSSGTSGSSGSSGTSGSSGSSGTSGSSGSSGTSGSSGSSGTSGSSGSSGTSGSSGSSGTSGSSGSSGTSGSSGSSGTSGSSGSSGTSGSSGSSGTSGSSGSSGTSGNSFTGGTVNYDENGRFTLESDDRLDDINVDGFKTITGGTYLSASTTLELYNNLSETIEITGFTSGGGTDISVSANTGLGIVEPNTLFTIYNSALSPTLEMDTKVGGIDAGTKVEDLTGKTFVDMFNDLLFPTVLPTYSLPTIELIGITDETLEVGSEKSVAVEAYAVKKDAGDFTSLRIRTGTTLPNVDVVVDNSPTASLETPIPDQFGYENPNNPNSGFTSIQWVDTFNIPAPSVGSTSSTIKYDAEGDCNAGLPKYNNKGNLDNRSEGVTTNTPQQARTNLNANDFTITGIYPYFYGKSSGDNAPTAQEIATAISGGTATKVLLSANGTLTIDYNTNGAEWIWFAHFENYPSKTVWYITELNQGVIGNSLMDNFYIHTMNGLSTDNYWSGVNFKVYVSSYPTTLTDNIQFKNS